MKIFRPKMVEISNFELQESYIPQKKAENVYKTDSARKNKNFCKSKDFFQFFWFFSTCSRTPKKFWRPIFKTFSKKTKKWLLWDLSILERNKVMSFGELSPDPVKTADGFMVGGAIMAPPCGIGLTTVFYHFVAAKQLWFDFCLDIVHYDLKK